MGKIEGENMIENKIIGGEENIEVQHNKEIKLYPLAAIKKIFCYISERKPGCMWWLPIVEPIIKIMRKRRQDHYQACNC